HIALEIDPRSIEIRSKLREILEESGDAAGAIAESVNLAAIYIDQGDPASAEPLLRRVLQSEPSHEGARALMLQVSPRARRRSSMPTAGQPRYAEVDPSAPLPSYDLEEVSAAEALQTERDDFEHEAASIDVSAPLPSFPLASDEPQRVL